MSIITSLCDSLLENLYNIASLELKDLKDIRLQSNKVLNLAIRYLSTDQREFFDIVTSPNPTDSNVQLYMLSGLPGTGKSFLQSTINLYFRLQRKDVLSLAPTNLLAHQQKGKTIHSIIGDNLCSKLGITKFKCQHDFLEKLIISNGSNNIRHMSLQQLCDSIKDIIIKNNHTYDNEQTDNSNLIILLDEGTMVCPILFSLLYFGYPNAKYIIMYGPNQLPPIVTIKEVGFMPSCDVMIAKENPDKVLFYELKTQKRFISENNNILQEYVNYFSDVLSNKCENQTLFDRLNKMEYFLKRLKVGGNLEDYKKLKDSRKILLVNTNRQRCDENALRLAQEGEGPVYTIPTIRDPNLPSHYNIISRIGIDDELKIRKGVYCIIKINNLTLGLIKGQMIKILDIVEENKCVKKLKVQLVNDDSDYFYLEKMEIPTDYYLYPGREDSVLMVKQFPITLSYSLTVHSAQGKTLDCNIGINLIRDDVTAYFVCLTRVRKPSQLYVDEHPVYWLHRDMNIKTLSDIENRRKILKLNDDDNNDDDDNDDDLHKVVKKFKIPREYNNIIVNNDINEIIKKICS